MRFKKALCVFISLLLLTGCFKKADPAPEHFARTAESNVQTRTEKENERHKKALNQISRRYDAQIKKIRKKIGYIRYRYNVYGKDAELYNRRLERIDRAIKTLQKKLLLEESAQITGKKELELMKKELEGLFRKREELLRMQCAAEATKELEQLIKHLQSLKSAEIEKENRLHEKNTETIRQTG